MIFWEGVDEKLKLKNESRLKYNSSLNTRIQASNLNRLICHVYTFSFFTFIHAHNWILFDLIYERLWVKFLYSFSFKIYHIYLMIFDNFVLLCEGDPIEVPRINLNNIKISKVFMGWIVHGPRCALMLKNKLNYSIFISELILIFISKMVKII